MTRSEQICNEIAASFFCKEFVYENLKYHNATNNKVELCDALFEYASIYVPLQIKERSKVKGAKTDEAWLRDIVYGEAYNQIKATLTAIKENNIVVNDLYHQRVELDKNNLVFPIIVFDNPQVSDYKRIIIENDLKVNVFNIEDYKAMMESIIHPYDIIYYLQERIKWIEGRGLPNLIIGEGMSITMIAKIKNEGDFSHFFKLFIYEGKQDKQDAALKQLALIGTFRDRQIKKNPNYRQILKILQLIQPKVAYEFMSRFDYAWKSACENKFDFTKSMQLVLDAKQRISIVFFSVGMNELKEKSYYEVLCDAKQLQQKADAVLIISFIGDKNNRCRNDWVYYEKQYLSDNEMLKFYTEIGMFNGTMDYDLYEQLCGKLLTPKVDS